LIFFPNWFKRPFLLVFAAVSVDPTFLPHYYITKT
jgi:hypothetical protein